MPEIKNPTIKNMSNPELGELPLRADDTSVERYFIDKNIDKSWSLYTVKPNRFSNDYGETYNYYISGETYTTYWQNSVTIYEWRTEFGYYPIVDTIEYSQGE
jgi:hypothetical protein